MSFSNEKYPRVINRTEVAERLAKLGWPFLIVFSVSMTCEPLLIEEFATVIRFANGLLTQNGRSQVFYPLYPRHVTGSAGGGGATPIHALQTDYPWKRPVHPGYV